MAYDYGLKIKKIVEAKPKPIKLVQEATAYDFSSDRLGFFVIHLNRERNKIVVEHYLGRYEHKQLVSGTPDLIFEGASAERLCHTILQKGLVSRLEHAAYLGRELQKAEACLKTGEKYIQS